MIMRNKLCASQMVIDKPVIRYLRKAKDKKCFIISYIASGVRKFIVAH